MSTQAKVGELWVRMRPYVASYLEAFAIAAVLALPWALYFANWD